MNEILEPFAGGILIGLGSLLAMAASEKVPGISGIVARVIQAKSGDTAWRGVFLLGLIGGAALAFAMNLGPGEFSVPEGRSLTVYGLAGLLVGFGSRVGGGCTSGHGVCGMGSGAKDELLYTVIFMAPAALAVLAWNITTGGGAPG